MIRWKKRVILQRQQPEVFYKKNCSQKCCWIYRKTPVSVSFFKWSCRPLKRRLQHKCFPVNFAKFLRTLILCNMCERLLLYHPPTANVYSEILFVVLCLICLPCIFNCRVINRLLIDELYPPRGSGTSIWIFTHVSPVLFLYPAKMSENQADRCYC